MAARPAFVESRPVLILVLVVIIGQADHDQIIDTGSAEHKGFESACGAPVAVSKGMHGPDLIMRCQCLHDGVVLLEFSGYSVAKAAERQTTIISSFDSTTSWRPESNIGSRPAQRPGFAVVVVAAGHDATMDVQYELTRNRTVGRLRAEPAIGRIGCP